LSIIIIIIIIISHCKDPYTVLVGLNTYLSIVMSQAQYLHRGQVNRLFWHFVLLHYLVHYFGHVIACLCNWVANRPTVVVFSIKRTVLIPSSSGLSHTTAAVLAPVWKSSFVV